MAMLFDYWCRHHARFETWGTAGDRQPCPTCGEKSPQLPGARGVNLPFNDEGFPRAYRMWGDYHEREARRPPKL